MAGPNKVPMPPAGLRLSVLARFMSPAQLEQLAQQYYQNRFRGALHSSKGDNFMEPITPDEAAALRLFVAKTNELTYAQMGQLLNQGPKSVEYLVKLVALKLVYQHPEMLDKLPKEEKPVTP